MEEDLSEEEMERVLEMDRRLEEEVAPILHKLDQEFPNEAVFYAVFINTIHALYEEGWTAEELIEAVEEHQEIFLKNEAEAGGLH